MNIKITKEQFDILNRYTLHEYIFGSHLHKRNTENSDKDIVLILDDIFESDRKYPNVHCFQFDDIENNTQWVLTTESTFHKNLLSGESNIFAELVLFSDVKQFPDKLLTCRSYKIIKGFIGRAKFDLKLLNTIKDKKNKKSFHISRCIYIAECLLEDRLPELNDIGLYEKLSKEELQSKELYLRTKCNSLYENDELKLFPELLIRNTSTELQQLDELLMKSNNIKEFKYD